MRKGKFASVLPEILWVTRWLIIGSDCHHEGIKPPVRSVIALRLAQIGF